MGAAALTVSEALSEIDQNDLDDFTVNRHVEEHCFPIQYLVYSIYFCVLRIGVYWLDNARDFNAPRTSCVMLRVICFADVCVLISKCYDVWSVVYSLRCVQ